MIQGVTHHGRPAGDGFYLKWLSALPLKLVLREAELAGRMAECTLRLLQWMPALGMSSRSVVTSLAKPMRDAVSSVCRFTTKRRVSLKSRGTTPRTWWSGWPGTSPSCSTTRGKLWRWDEPLSTLRKTRLYGDMVDHWYVKSFDSDSCFDSLFPALILWFLLWSWSPHFLLALLRLLWLESLFSRNLKWMEINFFSVSLNYKGAKDLIFSWITILSGLYFLRDKEIDSHLSNRAHFLVLNVFCLILVMCVLEDGLAGE